MSDKQEQGQARDAGPGEPPNKEGSGEGSGSAFSAMLKKRREGQHGVPEHQEQGSEDAASTR